MNDQQKFKKIEEWLRDYNSMIGGIENLKEMVKDIAEEGFGVDISKEYVQRSNSFSSVTENAVIRLSEIDINGSIRTMTNIVNSIDRALNCLTDQEKTVVVNRCIHRRYYYQFLADVCVSERTAKRLKKEGIRKMSIVIFGK